MQAQVRGRGDVMAQSDYGTGPTAALGAFVGGLRFEDLPSEVVAQAGDVILDALGCAIGAWRDDPPKADVMARVVQMFQAVRMFTRGSVWVISQAVQLLKP